MTDTKTDKPKTPSEVAQELLNHGLHWWDHEPQHHADKIHALAAQEAEI